MEYRRLFLLVEGPDDERFFDEIIRPLFEERYAGGVEIRQYARQRTEDINNLLRDIEEQGDAYLLIADREAAACVTDKKEKLQKRMPLLAAERILIVVGKIEGWYLAGLDKENARRLKVPIFSQTDTIGKEEFNAAIPKKEKSRTYFMLKLLQYFDLETAKQKNKSFRYFIEKHLSDL